MGYKVIYGFDALAEEFKLKPKRAPKKDWAKSRQENFVKCPKCGGVMTIHSGTNVLQCDNVTGVENAEGIREKRVCGYIRLLDKESVNYGEYLFSGGNYVK